MLALVSSSTGCPVQIVWGDTINMMFSCSRDLSIRQWKLGTDTPLATLTGHTTNVAGLDISSDNATLCSGARDTSVRVWDINTSMQLFQAQLPRNLVRRAGRQIVAGNAWLMMPPAGDLHEVHSERTLFCPSKFR